jgi:hypothetical protein
MKMMRACLGAASACSARSSKAAVGEGWQVYSCVIVEVSLHFGLLLRLSYGGMLTGCCFSVW